VNHSKYSGRAVSLLVFLPLLFLPSAVTGQRLQESVVPLKNWAAPLYWQPNQAEREIAAQATPKLVFSGSQVSPSALTFVAVTPCRLVDTRGVPAGFNGLTPFSGPSLAASSTTTFPVQSAAEAAADTTPTPCGTIPSIAQAYSFNITAIPKTAGGIAFVTIWPSGGAQPAVSTINDGEGVILANAAIVPAGTPSGGVNVINSGPATMDLIIDMNGFYAAPSDLDNNTAIGTGALVSNTTGSGNTATGTQALQNNTSGADNTAFGYQALKSNSGSSGSENTAVGSGALQSNATGTYNTALGYQALGNNISGDYNVAIGLQAGFNVAGGNGNNIEIANAGAAGDSNTIRIGNGSHTSFLAGGIYGAAPSGGGVPVVINSNGQLGAPFAGDNVALGLGALQSNAGGMENTAVGYQALQGGPVLSANVGGSNTAVGQGALMINSGGNTNTAIGSGALFGNTTGSDNTAVGSGALTFNSTGSNNIAIGYNAAIDVNSGNGNNIDIGSPGSALDAGAIRIGASPTHTQVWVAGIATSGISGGTTVVVSGSGQLGIATSSRRYKEDIQDMGETSQGLMDLRPVTFHYKKPAEDGSKPLQYGLIAEEVAEVYPDLVVYTKDGQPNTVQYQMLPSMLLNEIQRQQAEIGAQKEQLHRLEQQVSEQRQQNQSLQERLTRLEAALISTSSASGVAAIR
jgi:trimeric autotransporter adhesin